MPTLLVCLALACGLGLRLLHLDAMDGAPLFAYPMVDALEYYSDARAHADGSFQYRIPAHPPLYPWLLSWFCSLDPVVDMHRLRLLTSLGGLLAAGLLFFAGRRSLGTWPAAAAACLLALYRPALLYECELYAASLAQLLVVASLLLCLRLRDGACWPGSLALGLSLGLASITRSNLFLLTPLCLLYLWRSKMAWPRLGTLAGLALAPVAVVCVLNMQAGDGFAFIQGRTGHNLYMANHRGSDGTVDIRPGPQYEAFRREPQIQGAIGPVAESGYYTEKTIDEILQAPGSWFGLLLRKLYNSLSPVEVASSYHNEGHQLYSWVLRMPLPGFAWLFPLALLGFLLPHARGPAWRLLTLYLGVIFATMLLGFPGGRYRYQLAGILCVFAGLGLERLISTARSRDGTRILHSSGVLLLGLVATFAAPRFKANEALWQAEYKTLEAQSLLQRDLLQRAFAAADAARKIKPDYAWAWFSLGAVSALDGQNRTALPLFAKASELFENFPEAWQNLGLMHLSQNEFGMARQALRKATQHWPGMVSAWEYLARVEDRLGNTDAARAARAKAQWARARFGH